MKDIFDLQVKWRDDGDFRHLPHVSDCQLPQFITTRLGDALPQHVLAGHNPTAEFKTCEAVLDSGYGACWLSDPSVAAIVQDNLLRFHGAHYLLHAWTIMPNHVHLLLSPLSGRDVASIMHSFKSYTAHAANRLLGRRGMFWQPDYFDRTIRSGDHYSHTIRYIELNPVSAGLVPRPEDWPFSSAARPWSVHCPALLER